jgi:glutathione synthase/RimK-type ligase-like ATP-grasp enzyme
MKIGILKSHNRDYKLYVEACEKLGIEYKIVDFIGKDWIKECLESGCDGFMARPPCDYQERKAVYDERLMFLNRNMNMPVYPGVDECLFYENKRSLVNWLDYYKLPHPHTVVLGSRKEALDYVEHAKYPFVSKRAIGSAASGVIIVKSKIHAKVLVNQFFGWGVPGFTLGKIYWSWVKKKYLLPSLGTEQKHYMICQDFCDVRWEHRIIRIGNTFLGYKKVVGKHGFASGSGLAAWGEPPREVLDMVRDITDKFGFRSIAIDIFETGDGKYLINEMQALFGSVERSLLNIDGKDGRYVYENGEYKFEEGYYNVKRCYELRVLDFVDCLKAKGIK